MGRSLCARVLQVLEESVRRRRRSEGGEGEGEGEDVVVVLESLDILLHAGVGYEGVMDLVMGVLEVLPALPLFFFLLPSLPSFGGN